MAGLNGAGKKILIGKKDIMGYLDIRTDYQFKRFIEMGMPANFIENRWYAHGDNIDAWFRKLTGVVIGKVIGEEAENA